MLLCYLFSEQGVIVRKLLIFSCVTGSLLFLNACSVTTLRCGINGDDSYVDLTNVPQDLPQNVRAYSRLCGFVYEGDDDA